MSSIRGIRWTAVMFIAMTASQIVACKAGDELVNPPALAVPDFTPKVPLVTTRYVSMAKGAVSEQHITLDIAITDVSEPITAIAIKLHYPREFSRFYSCSDGNLFSPPGTCYATDTSAGSGEVFLARSISAPSEATTVTGTKVVMKVEFVVFGRSADDVVFEATNLGGGDASAVLDVNGDPILMTWYSGTLVGR
jgi:hypothetical protein